MSSGSSPISSEIRPITGLRALAVLAVVLFHIDADFAPYGYLGVDLFFVISGFVVTNRLLRVRRAGELAEFYYGRVRRLFPALAVTFMVFLAIGWFVTLPEQFVDAAEQARAGVLIHANYYFLFNTDYFSPDASTRIFLHIWSLSVEEQFYIIFPIMIVIVRPRWTKALLVGVVGAASFFYARHLLMTGQDMVAFYSLFARAWQFAVGSIALLALVLANRFLPPSTLRWFSVLQLPSLAVVVMGFFLPADLFPEFRIQRALCLAAAVLLFTSTQNSMANRGLGSDFLRYFGLRSYSIYLYHWPLIVLASVFMNAGWAFWVSMFFGSVLLGDLSYRFIENPFRRSAGFNFGRWPRLASAATASALLIVGFSTAVIAYDGLPSRLPARVQEAIAAGSDMDSDLARCFDPPGRPYQEVLPEIAEKDELCRIGDADATKLSFALIGDSHGFSMSPAIDAAGKKAGQKGLMAVHAACPPLSGMTHGMASDHQCARFFDAVRQSIIDHDIRVIFLVARWDLYLFGGMPGGIDAATPAILQYADDYNSPIRPLQAFADGVTRTLNAFPGRTVVFVQDNPQHLNSIPIVAAANRMIGRSIDRYLVDRDTVEQRWQQVRNILDQKATANLIVFETLDRLCPENLCSYEQDGKIIYWDDDHLNRTGAMLFSDDFAGMMDKYGHPESQSLSAR